MYTYRNKRNGTTFTTPCACAGEDYEEVEVPALASKAKGGKKPQAAADSDAEDS